MTLQSRKNPEESGDFVKSLDRGIAVMNAFDEHHTHLTLADVAKICSISRASARRYLFTLEYLGYLRTDGKVFWLTPKMLNFGYSYLSGQPLREVAEPYLHELSVAVGESVSVSILEEDSIVYIARVATEQIITVAISVGTRLPATTTSMGRVLLANMSDKELDEFLRQYPLPDSAREKELRTKIAQCAERGYAIVDQELEQGLRAIAMPIKDRSGNVIAAINVSTRVGTQQSEFETLTDKILPLLKDAAEKISTDYAYNISKP